MDRETFKKDNEKKFKNKQRYKKHVKKDESSTPIRKKTEETLPSNWTKYEINSDEDVIEKANFETLLDKPVSQESYFKFKNEENWSKHVEFHSQFQKYFTLDINLLNTGVSCVKFSERHGYNDDLFKNLDDVSKETDAKYEAYLNKICTSKKMSSIIENIDIDNKHKEENHFQLKFEEKENQPNINDKIYLNSEISIMKDSLSDNIEDVDSLIHSTEEMIVKECIVDDPLMAKTSLSKSVTKITNTSEDLEQWLDDILDD